MIAYLANGWFTEVGPRKLRAEVVDGALDSASSLHQAGVPAEALHALMLRVRTLAFLLARDRGQRGATLDAQERDALRYAVQEATDAHVALQAFLLDCCEHIGDTADMRGLYLHLLHIGHVSRLLHMARAQTRHSMPAKASSSVSRSESSEELGRQWQTPR